MKMLLTPIAYATMAMAGSSALAQAQDPVKEISGATSSNTDTVEEVFVLGTRRAGRTDTQSVVPVDVIQPDAIGSTGYSDLNDSLRTLVPAFNVRRLPLNDGSSFVRPATLRSSPADHVLLLLNGKRRHRSATVQIGTGHATTSGSQGQDFNILPPIAFKSIQVLRDGASAQYGSDAIAGVINLSLKDASEGGSVTVETGEYFDGGGETIDVQGNIGLALTDDGFLNLSAQVIDQAESIRVGTHLGAQGLREMGVPGVPSDAGGTGDPEYKAVKTAWNAGLDLGGGRQAYLFGNYLKSESEVGFSYRQSQDAGGLGAHSTFADSLFDNTPAHPSTFDLTELYPGGYIPQFGGDQDDFSTIVGVRQEENELFGWDASFRWGRNEIEYSLWNTINASMGAESPTSFKPGALAQREYELSLEVFKSIPVDAFASDLFLFGGFNHRDEQYTISAGDRDSYQAGALIDLPVGANGFQGYSPDTAGDFSASSYAGYIEAEVDFTEQWTASAAVRYEDYEAFGDNLSHKLATRFDFNENFAIRGAMTSGFRAPAAGQLFGTSQTSQLAANGDFILDAVLVPGSDAASIFNSNALEAETSDSISAGLVLTLERFTATLDFYQIDVDDRLLLSDQIDTTAEQRAQLAAIGYPNGISVRSVRFFQNQLDTRVRGADLVATYFSDYENSSQSTDYSLAVSYNEQILRSDPEGVFTDDKVLEFEEGIPSWRGNFTVTHHIGDFDLMGRATYYGEWTRVDRDYIKTRDGEFIFDAEVTYRGFDQVSISVGARNLDNKYPPPRRQAFVDRGTPYDNHSVFGLSGGFYYARLRYEF
ncbi:TonB-dependent receptor plug domain-containing protein [Parahaliea mediterranea]|uniref:TonB-dependent receptor n=1 Tax=Parahaliea mediterranea TaxID=651086 RepID=A0A939DJ35_9GAMM|nr:TonB-dependent receptor [Parahaliea mediterranea]MBN7798761.1 TonB-dependent receptor [Parahaliea mediterranea]